jgi:hypothetical protein
VIEDHGSAVVDGPPLDQRLDGTAIGPIIVGTHATRSEWRSVSTGFYVFTAAMLGGDNKQRRRHHRNRGRFYGKVRVPKRGERLVWCVVRDGM